MKFGAFIVGLLIIAGCSTDNFIYPPPEAAYFNLFIENNTQNKISIYLQASHNNSQGFEHMGNLAVGEELEITELGVRQTYIVRAAVSDSPPQNYFYQQLILRDSPTDVFLTIE